MDPTTPDESDQSRPARPGFVRVPGFLDVRAYDDLGFIEYARHDRAWQFILSGYERRGLLTPAIREALFNTEHFEDSAMARAWNEFMARRDARQGGPTP